MLDSQTQTLLEAENKQLRGLLERANADLARSTAELQQFAYIASHDLQAPLRRISSFVQILKEDYTEAIDDTGKQWIDRTVAGVDTMQELIDGLLAYSRIETQAFRPVSIDLNAMVDDLIERYIPPLGEHQSAISRDNLPVVCADSEQLTQLLKQIISNGLKFNDSKTPQVHLSARCENTEVILCVKDNGIGIKQKHHQRIFDIFQRLHPPQTYSGSGIGLSLCRRIINRHGGNIWLDSEPGVGSSFYVSFPVPN